MCIIALFSRSLFLGLESLLGNVGIYHIIFRGSQASGKPGAQGPPDIQPAAGLGPHLDARVPLLAALRRDDDLEKV